MEIRIVLDRAEPPVGRLRVVDSGQAHSPHTGQEVGFTGWLGLLRSLYEATSQPRQDAGPGP